MIPDRIMEHSAAIEVILSGVFTISSLGFYGFSTHSLVGSGSVISESKVQLALRQG